MPFLAPEPFRLNDRDALQPDLVQGLLYLIELERLDDSFNFFHVLQSPAKPSLPFCQAAGTHARGRGDLNSILGLHVACHASTKKRQIQPPRLFVRRRGGRQPVIAGGVGRRGRPAFDLRSDGTGRLLNNWALGGIFYI